MHVFTFRIAGVGFRLESNIAVPRLGQPPYRSFEAEVGQPDIEILMMRLEGGRSRLSMRRRCATA